MLTKIGVFSGLTMIIATGVALTWISNLDPSNYEKARQFYFSRILGTPLMLGKPRSPVDCRDLKDNNTVIILALGQSNAANYGEIVTLPENSVFSFHQGECFRARDPMLGADGFGGSPWPKLGDKIVRSGAASRVLFANLAVGGVTVSEWIAGGSLQPKLEKLLADLKTENFQIDFVLWHQGESDALERTSKEHYMARLRELISMLRDADVAAPILISVATYCKGRSDDDLADAQQQIVDNYNGIFEGPNTDLLVGEGYRYDDCHFSESGLSELSEKWFQKLSVFSRFAR